MLEDVTVVESDNNGCEESPTGRGVLKRIRKEQTGLLLLEELHDEKERNTHTD